MSTDAVTWAMDHAPMLRTDKGKPDTTARHVLQALAEHARPDGTGACPSVLRIQYRTGYDRTTVQRALRRLEKGELIARDGMSEGRTRWKLAMHLRRPETDWSDLEREEDDFRAAAAERKRRSRSKGVTHSASVTVTHSEPATERDIQPTPDDVTDAESVTVTDAEPVTADVTHSTPSRHALKVRSSRTERRPNHQQPSDNQLLKDSSSPAAQTDEPPEQLHLEAFGAFWLTYPKRKAKEEAKKAWIAAIKRGADPQHIVTAAKGYAHERQGQDAKYTKYPATWLNKGCYDDEPDPQPEPNGRPHLRAVSGGHVPFQCPPASAYENDQGF